MADNTDNLTMQELHEQRTASHKRADAAESSAAELIAQLDAMTRDRDEVIAQLARLKNEVVITNGVGDTCTVRIALDGSPVSAKTIYDMASFTSQLREHFPIGVGREWSIYATVAYPVEVQNAK